MKTLILTLGLTLTGCSVDVHDASEADAATKNAEAADEPTPATTGVSVSLQGYIASAFEVEVDNESFADSEDFYTRQLDRLLDEAALAGYRGYDLKFDAELGLGDMKRGMRVYVIGGESRGYGAEASVQGDGTFSMMVPSDGTYRIRAVKRINVILTKGKKTVQWCYNFSAVEQAIDLTDTRPVIMRSFETRITKYACETTIGGGITIPKITEVQSPVEVPAPVEVKAELAQGALNERAP